MSVATASPRAAGRGGDRVAAAPYAALALAGVVASVVILRAGRGSTFFLDEWSYLRVRQGWAPADFLEPHNEHLTAIPVLVYKLLFATAGLADYAVYRVVGLAANLLCGALVFVYATRRVGPWIAVALATVLVLMGPAWIDVLWPFQITFTLALAAGVGALLALDRGDRRGDAVACGLLCVSLACSGVGVPFLAGVAVEVVLHRSRARRWWIVAVPAVVYAIWHVAYSPPSGSVGNLRHVPRWAIAASNDAAGAITGLGPTAGKVLACLLALGVAVRLIRTRPIDARLAGLATMPLVLWGGTALVRYGLPGVVPEDPKYLYPGGLFLGLAAVEALKGHAPTSWRAAVVVAVLLAGAVHGARLLERDGGGLRARGPITRAALTAIDLAPDRVDTAAFASATEPLLRVRDYEQVVDHFASSPAYPVAALAGAPAAARAAADDALLRLRGRGVVQRTAATACLRVREARRIDMALPRSGLVVRAGRAPVEVRLRRFGDAFAARPQAIVRAAGAATLAQPADASARPWHVELRGAAPLRACPA